MHLTYSPSSNNKSSKGFTLVELSIVLVIIGLIIGSVLVGQSLIRAAENRAIIEQITSFYAGVNTFRSRFNALPGDFAQATTYIGTVCPGGAAASLVNGNGDGLITSAATPPTAISSEMSNFWCQLSAVSMIPGSYNGLSGGAITLGANFPLLSTGRGGIIAYSFTDYNNYYLIGLASSSGTIATSGDLTPQGAYEIDNKMDDGIPGTGTVQARGAGALEVAASNGALGSANCLVTGPPLTYNTGAPTGYFCELRVQFQ